jgi:hypothetical protein
MFFLKFLVSVTEPEILTRRSVFHCFAVECCSSEFVVKSFETVY